MPLFFSLHKEEEAENSGFVRELRTALDSFEDSAILRSRPAVLASRRACLDAHDFDRINAKSPLLSRRQMRLDFDDGSC